MPWNPHHPTAETLDGKGHAKTECFRGTWQQQAGPARIGQLIRSDQNLGYQCALATNACKTQGETGHRQLQ